MNHILKCHDITKTDFVRGEGCYLFDAQGRKYTDFESGIWCTALGFSHPRINKIMKSQIDRVIHLGTRYPNVLAEAAAIRILSITGIRQGKCVFLSSGSEAVEFGSQIARRVTGRPLLLTFENSYLAAYGSAGLKRPGEWQLLNWNDCDPLNPEGCLSEIPFDRIGAFIFEPGGSGSCFVRFPPDGLVAEIARRVKQAGGLIVANEVTAGMGRTGKWFGFQHYDVQPDIVALGKGLGNGYPISAVVMTEEIAHAVESSDFRYAQSHQNDPLGCAVACEVIDVMREERLIERSAMMGAWFLEKLRQFSDSNVLVKDVRGRGMLLGLELHPNAPVPVQSLYQFLLEKGILTGYYPGGNMMRFDPALIMTENDVEHLLDSLTDLLRDQSS